MSEAGRYLPRPSRTRVHGAKSYDRPGTAAGWLYQQDLAALLARIGQVQWEDLDPDTDPYVPPRPVRTWVDVTDRAVFEPDEDYQIDQETKAANLNNRSKSPRLVEVLTFSHADNYEECLAVEDSIYTQTEPDGCWLARIERIALYPTKGKPLEVDSRLAMWLNEYGEDVTSQTWFKHYGNAHGFITHCVRPSHLHRHN